MQIVTDSGADIVAEQIKALKIQVVPLSFTLDGKTYLSGVDIDVAGFYKLLQGTDGFPTTAQPAPGEFAKLYRQLAQTDPDILSIHISSGLSGTYNAAVEGAKLVPEAKVTHWDSKTLSVALGWQVLAAAQGVKNGLSKEQIFASLEKLRTQADAMFTLNTLKYLVHGGRVSHIRGMLASMLDLKPIIGVTKDTGVYEQRSRVRSIKNAVEKLVDVAASRHSKGIKMRVQILQGDAPELVEQVTNRLKETFDCVFMPTIQIAPVLGAHTGPALIGFGYMPEEQLAGIPL